ncbi:MAG: sigma-70 family RNA polymerase sigma factor [Planctomycetes bacterium]|nr:sigma-70 family RNA polymerase sigma factor [Planctomycetota bacterium]
MGIPCDGCEHFDGAKGVCAPLARRRIRPILEGGACRILAMARDFARRYIGARYPEARDRIDDVVQEVGLKLAGAPPEGEDLPSGYPGLRRWLFTVTANAATDLLRRERIVAKRRCGACAHYSSAPPPGCRRGSVRDPATGVAHPNPWFGGRVTAETDPRGLRPPCDGFFWRYRPRALDRGTEDPRATDRPGEEEDAREIHEAVARLAARGPEGLRRALAVYRHYVEGERTEAIAEAIGVSARTIRREIERGLEDLREILSPRPGAVRLPDGRREP